LGGSVAAAETVEWRVCERSKEVRGGVLGGVEKWQAAAKDTLAIAPHSQPRLQRTISSPIASPLCYEPVVLSIETKSPGGRSENCEVQLSLWAMANFNRLRQLIQDPVVMTIPLLLVTDARWKLYFASDLVHRVHLLV
ncbi:hypothetical protein PMIN01_08127, partial [Paraphaeosphaeria minitans]